MNNSIKLASIFGALAVGIGAFGAHALKDFLVETERLDTFQTAVQYHFYHTLALLAIGVLKNFYDSKQLVIASYLIIAGILIFSGSLYILCLTQANWLGAITPLGGVALIGGWILLFASAIKKA